MSRSPSPRCAVLALVIAVGLLAVPAIVRSQDESKIALSLLDLVLYVEEQARNGKRSEIPLPRSIPSTAAGACPS